MLWTPDMDRRVIEGRAQGKTFAQIGRSMQRSRSAVSGRWCRLTNNEPPKHRTAPQKPVDRHHWRKAKEIKAATHATTVDNSCPKYADDDAHIVAARAAGGFPYFIFKSAKRR